MGPPACRQADLSLYRNSRRFQCITNFNSQVEYVCLKENKAPSVRRNKVDQLKWGPGYVQCIGLKCCFLVSSISADAISGQRKVCTMAMCIEIPGV